MPLTGAPGVYSARYAGDGARDEDNNRKLIEALRDRGIHTLPPEHPGRSARFVCALVYFDPATGRKIQAEGECPGLILDHPRGQGGFGYDPLFYLPEFGKTMAELTPEEKNRVSHRGKALRSLIEKITSL